MSISDRAKKLFCEMPTLDDTALSLSDKKGKAHGGLDREEDVQNKYEQSQDEWQHIRDFELDNGSRIEWFKDTTTQQARGFLLSPSDDIMGLIAGSTRPYDNNLPSFLRIHLIMVYDEFQRRGFGTELYKSAINMFGGILSDRTLSAASLGVWKKLSKKYPTYKYEHVHGGEKTTQVLKPIKNLDKEMGTEWDPFIMSKKPLK